MTHEQRIGHLETKCKRLTLVLSGMMVMAVAMLFIAAKPKTDEDTIQARKLEIVDENGKVRIRLGSADAGYGLVVYDDQGQFRATLTDAPLGAVSQLNKDGGSIKLMAMKNGCGITMRDGDGKPRAIILQQKEGSKIMLKDAEGKDVFSAPEQN
ncbi:MAG TPA: hypothetical protein DDY76_05605 [Opitutae bacterium]|nr:hypothetical protein [Opitutae bacterium]|tara:strand:- start:2387 stop:2848 length:462 start_codon:yes stop_codon:yes gene_type:complete